MGQHTHDPSGQFLKFLRCDFRMKSEPCSNDDLSLDFAKRTTGDGEKVTKLAA